MIFIGLCYLCLCVRFGSSYNVDLDTRTVHRSRVDGQWFGFSVALHKTDRSQWILVGAPRSQTNQVGVTRGGHVYKCDPLRQNSCQPVFFDTLTHTIENMRNIGYQRSDNKSEQWFGATVVSGGYNQSVVACAPRYIYYSISGKRREPVGNCFLADAELQTFKTYSPCRTDTWGWHRQGWCQAGFSTAISRDGGHLFIGAPGSWQWQGQIFSQNLRTKVKPFGTEQDDPSLDVTYMGYSTAVGEFSGDSLDEVVVGRPRGENLTGEIIVYDYSLTRLMSVSGEQIGSYFGYSLAVADINNDKLDDIVVGVPFYNDYENQHTYELGQIHILYQTEDHQFNRQIINGRQSKGRFGLSLASLGDIDGDSYADIVVGAPYEGKRGAIYIFNGGSDGLTKEPSQIIYASDIDNKITSFGFSLSGGMDMDSNNYPDLAVGSYESDVVVFLRSRKVVTIIPTVEISPQSILLDERTCKLKDGSPVSCIDVNLCFEYLADKADKNIDVSYVLKLDNQFPVPRMFFLEHENISTMSFPVSLSRDQHCEIKVAYIHKKIYDKLTPLSIKVRMNLPTDRTYNRNKRQTPFLRPIINKKVGSATKMVEFQHKCGSDKICIPDLQLKVKSNVKEYVVGEGAKNIELEVEVENMGENAYATNLYVDITRFVDYNFISKNFTGQCNGPIQGSTIVKCSLGNPFEALTSVKFTMYLTPRIIKARASSFALQLHVNSTNSESNTTLTDNSNTVEIPLRANVTFTISGRSTPQTVSYNVSIYTDIKKNASEEDIGPEIVHTFKIGNGGRSKILRAELIIMWPAETLSYKPFFYVTRQPESSSNIICKRIVVNPSQLNLAFVDSKLNDISAKLKSRQKREVIYPDTLSTYYDEMNCKSASCIKINCTVTNLQKEEFIAVGSRLWVPTIKQLGLSAMEIESKIIARVTELPYQIDPTYLGYTKIIVKTVIDPIKAPTERLPIPWWILAVSACVGLILLIIIVVVLWRIGFFTRKKYLQGERGKSKNGYHSPQPDDAYL